MGIKCTQRTATYDMDMAYFGDFMWLYLNGAWRKQKNDDYRLEDWWHDKYKYGEVSSSQIVICWALNYLPGLKEWDASHLSLTFDLEEVEKAGWTLTRLEHLLTQMRTKVVRGRRAEASEPYETSRIGEYGATIYKVRHPAPLPLLDMLTNPHPFDLETE